MKVQVLFYTKEKGWSEQFQALDSQQTLVVVFAAQEYIDNQNPINDLINAFPQAKIIGCSTAGEIIKTSVVDSAVTVAIVKFEKTALASINAKVETPADSFAAGKKIAEKLMRNDLRGIFVLSDGLHVNGSRLIEGLNSSLPHHIIVTGGLAGDGDRFKNTWVICCNNQFRSKHISAVGFYGDKIKIGHGSRGGWDSFGPERRVTKSKNNILYELDGKPALALYKEYLGERSKELPASALLFPLAIRRDEQDSKEIVRTILAVNEEDESMTFAGDVPTGYLAKLMYANFDRLISGANEAAIVAGDVQRKAHPILAIAISCVGRRLLLGEYIEEETESILESLPKETLRIGYYSYGEISPFATGHCDLHNQTMTLTTLSEE